MNDIKVLGIDLAKNVFQLHGTDNRGKRILALPGVRVVCLKSSHSKSKPFYPLSI